MKVVRNCALSCRLIFRYAPGNALLYLLVCTVPGFFSGLRVILVQSLVDSGVAYAAGGQGMETMLLPGIFLVGMLFMWFVFEWLQVYQDKVLETKLIRRMAPDILDKLNRLEYASFEAEEVQGILQRIGEEPWLHVKECFTGSLQAAHSLLSIGFMLGVYAAVSHWIGAGIFLVAIPMLAMNFAATKKLHGIIWDTTPQTRRIEDLKRLLQDKNAMYEMKIFGSQEMIAEKWSRASDGVEAEIKKGGGKVLALEGGSKLLNVTYFVFIIITLSYLFLHGRVTVGQFASVAGSLNSITKQIFSASWTVTGTFRNALNVEFYREFLAIQERTDIRNTVSPIHGDIVFENVSFTYPGTERPVLKNVTFRIKAGERVAFVGENGAGKSTIVKLLCGLYEPDGGSVLAGGVNVRDLSEPLRKKLLSAVFQDFQLQLPWIFSLLLLNIKAPASGSPGLEAQKHVGGIVNTAGFLECRHDFTESGIDVHGHHVDPGNHDVLGQGIREIEYIVNHFPLFRFDNAVRMADFHIGAQLGLCHGGNLLTGVNVQYAEDAV